jgi:hypothetical protein
VNAPEPDSATVSAELPEPPEFANVRKGPVTASATFRHPSLLPAQAPDRRPPIAATSIGPLLRLAEAKLAAVLDLEQTARHAEETR